MLDILKYNIDVIQLAESNSFSKDALFPPSQNNHNTSETHYRLLSLDLDFSSLYHYHNVVFYWRANQEWQWRNILFTNVKLNFLVHSTRANANW